MSYFQTIFFSIIEGVTEFLPVSSTGHLILTAKVLGLDQSEFLKSFEIAIQFGAICSIIFLYWEYFLKNNEILKRLAVAFIPTGVLGFIFYKLIKMVLLDSEQIVLWSLFLGGIFLIAFEFVHFEKKDAVENLENISYKHCFFIGIFQSVAMIPGISRAAATIIGGLLLGLKRKIIVEFSFLLAVPTMLTATGYDLLKSGSYFSLNQFGFLGIGFLCSFFAAIIGVKFLLKYIKNNSFVWFGVYRVVLALAFWIVF